MEKKTSTLADGVVIPRVYEDDHMEQKRIDAINRLGKKWILHPANSPKKQKVVSAIDSFKKKMKANKK